MRSPSKRRSAQRLATAQWKAFGDNVGFDFTLDQVTQLQGLLAGTVVLATDPEYLHARQAFMPSLPAFPQLVVYCECVRDVVHCLDFANANDLWVACRGGGHSTAAFSINTGMVIDLSRMNDVSVDPVTMRAVVGAGTNFGKLNAVLDTYHVHVPGGGCPDVSIGGYVQGGGYGVTSMIYGMNCDNVERVLIALWDGTLVDADRTTNADLFWAVRGGTGGNFGVLLEVEYRLHELWQVWGFGIFWPLADAPTALDVLQREFTGSAAPPRLGHQAILGVSPDPTTQKPVPSFNVLGVYDGSAEEGKAALDSLLATPGAVLVADLTDTYTTLNELFFASDPAPQPRTLADSRYVTRPLGADGWSRLTDFVATSPNPGNFVAFEPYGGAVLETSATACAFNHRDAGFDVFIWVFWMNDEEEQHSLAYLDQFRELMDELGNGAAFQNYPNRSNDRFREMFWGDSYPTLQAVKHKYDPHGFFHFQQSIAGAPPEPGEQLLVDVSAPIAPSTRAFRPPPVIGPSSPSTKG